MEYNTCDYCGAKDGRAGMIWWKVLEDGSVSKGACENCNDTLNGDNTVVIHSHLSRTPEELQKTMALARPKT